MRYKVIEICPEQKKEKEILLQHGWEIMTEVVLERGTFEILMKEEEHEKKQKETSP